MTSLTTTPTDAIIFRMASAISQEHPEIDIPTAISIAAKVLPIAGGQRASPSSKQHKPKKPRSKNAYMFYLDSVRAEIKQELTSKSEDPDAKIRVSEITKIAGARWKQLPPSEKAPFEKLALDAKNALAESLLNPSSSPSHTDSDLPTDNNSE
tara:strand:- start:15 stop:473 length:459 start_codon:yes stop_codon:yes gene_type:complete